MASPTIGGQGPNPALLRHDSEADREGRSLQAVAAGVAAARSVAAGTDNPGASKQGCMEAYWHYLASRPGHQSRRSDCESPATSLGVV